MLLDISAAGAGAGATAEAEAGAESRSPQYTTLAELDQLLADGDDIDAALPSYHALQTAVSHARDWLAKVRPYIT